MVQYRIFGKTMIYMLFSLFAMNAFGQFKSFSREEMIQDIDMLFSTIEQVHPNMHAVYTKQQFDKDLEKVKAELAPSGDIFYLFNQVTPLVVKLGDGHTNVFPSFFNDVSEYGDNVLLFPFAVKVFSDKIISIQYDYTPSQKTIPTGAQITKINNRYANDLVREMINYSSGEKDFYRIDKLGWLFTPLMYTLYRDTVFDIEYFFNQKTQTAKVNGIPLKELMKISSQQSGITPSVLFTFSTLPKKNIGVMEFNQFTDMDKFKIFLDSTFQVLQKENIGNLIIDIRKNGGGDSRMGDELFQYISPVPFAQFGKTIVKYSDILKEFYNTNYNREFTNPNGIEIYNEDMELLELRENPLRYKGNVFLLISHSTFSSAGSFSWAFKYFKMGTVIGEETGGMAVCFGDVINPSLPNSGLLFGVSHKKFYQYGATDDNIHGTLPDYEIQSEKALDFAIDLITK